MANLAGLSHRDRWRGHVCAGAWPRWLTWAAGSGEDDQFRMYDDDILYCSGRLVSAGGWDGEEEFGPLDDFGMPNAGAVTIKYKVGAVWKTL